MKKLIVIALAVIALCGCDAQITEKPVENQDQKILNEIKTKVIGITPSPTDVQAYEVMGEYEIDLTDGENDDVITLYTSAQRDTDGNMMWDDTQEWVVQVETDYGVYELYKSKIHGNVYMNVSDFYTDEEDKTVVTVIAVTNASNEIIEYVFDDDNFTQYSVYTTDSFAKEGINPLYTTIPQYR